MKRILLVLICCNMSMNMVAQHPDTSQIQETINEIINEKFTDSLADLYLVNEPVSKLIENSIKVDVFKELKDLFTEQQLKSFNDSSSAWSKAVKWDGSRIKVKVIDIYESRLLLDSNLLWSRIRSENEKRKRKKQEHRLAVIIHASIPIIIDDYCLILLSSATGGTYGRQCLYLYKREGERWKVKRTIGCRFS